MEFRGEGVMQPPRVGIGVEDLDREAIVLDVDVVVNEFDPSDDNEGEAGADCSHEGIDAGEMERREGGRVEGVEGSGEGEERGGDGEE